MHRLKTFWLSLLLLSLSAAPLFAETPAGFEHLEDARALYQAGHWDDAAAAFERAYGLAEERGEIRAAVALEWGGLLWEQGAYSSAESLVQEAIELARELGRDDATGQLLVTLGHIEAAKGELNAAENTLNICVQLTGELGDDVHRALCRLNRRVVRTLRGKSPGSEADFRNDIATLQRSETPLSVGTSLAKTAQLYMEHNDFERAKTLLDEAQRAYQRAGSVPAMSRNRLRMVQLLHRQGDFEAARPMLSGLLTQFETMRNRPMVVQTLALQAEAALNDGDRSRGFSLYRRALATAQEINNPQLVGRLHLSLCELNVAESLAHCESAASTFADAEMRLLEIRARTGLARHYQNTGDLSRAKTTYEQAISLLEDTVDVEGAHRLTHALQLSNLCQVLTNLTPAEAFETCQRALTSFDKLTESERARYPSLNAATRYAAGRAAIAANRGTSALNYLAQAAELYMSLDEPQPLLAADVLLRRGVVQANVDSERELAAGTFTHALQLTNELERSHPDVARTRISLKNQLAQLHLAAEDWTGAIATLEPLIEEAQAADDARTGAWALSAIARAYLQTQRRDDARAALNRALPLAKTAGDEALTRSIESNLERLGH